MKIEEGYLDVPGGKVWYRAVGDNAEATPLLNRRIAGSQLVIIEDASHLCFAEQPEEFNRVINSFMT